MSFFTVPDNSSPPSTPDSRFRGEHPSTTPAGPPPSALSFTPQRPFTATPFSSTPAGPPPPTLFGATQNQPASSLRSSAFGNGETSFATLPPFNPPSANRSNIFGSQQASQLGGSFSFASNSFSAPKENVAPPIDGDLVDLGTSILGSPSAGSLHDSPASQQIDLDRNSTFSSTRLDPPASFALSLPTANPVDSTVAPLARSLAFNMVDPSVTESGDLIMAGEAAVAQLYEHAFDFNNPAAMSAQLSTASIKLRQAWSKCERPTQETPSEFTDFGASVDIMNIENEAPLQSALVAGKLLLLLHHPPRSTQRQDVFRMSARRTETSSEAPQEYAPYPRLLTDWLNEKHDNFSQVLRDVNNARPSVASHDSFWEVVQGALLRGKVGEAIMLLKKADFSSAKSSYEDNSDTLGYRGQTLTEVKMVVSQAMRVLEKCPLHQSKDWDIRGHDWTVFRRQVWSALSQLVVTAEGEDTDPEDGQRPDMVAQHFGIAKPVDPRHSLKEAARRVESKIPWTIYQRLCDVYKILLCRHETIIRISENWLEAVIFLTTWWPGDLNKEPKGYSWAGRLESEAPRSLAKERSDYLQRLSVAFARTTDSSREIYHPLRMTNNLEVVLGCLFEGSIGEVLGVLKRWSLPIASAVSDFASIGGWFPVSKDAGLMADFDQDDLMLLSSPPKESPLKRDDVLISYADGLFNRPKVSPQMEGWEVAVSVLGRVDNEQKANKKLGDLLATIALDSRDKVDRLLSLCNTHSLLEQGQKVAERYANDLAQSSYEYGTVITYLARAHAEKKVKGVLDLLVSYSLVQSRAYPPAEELDLFLRGMINSPRDMLKDLSAVDSEAALIISVYLSGYATLRKFYELRDLAVLSSRPQTKAQLTNSKRQAFGALVAVINSSSDSIKGGLFDPESRAVILVDCLANLLGEALPFIGQSPNVITYDQSIALQTAMLDLEMVNPLVRKQTEELLGSSLASFQAENQRLTASFSSKSGLRKSVSSLTALSESEFELVGSELLNSGMGASGVMVPEPSNGAKKIARGWDWRSGLPHKAGLADIFRILRLGLIDEVCRSWAADPYQR